MPVPVKQILKVTVDMRCELDENILCCEVFQELGTLVHFHFHDRKLDSLGAGLGDLEPSGLLEVFQDQMIVTDHVDRYAPIERRRPLKHCLPPPKTLRAIRCPQHTGKHRDLPWSATPSLPEAQGA